MKSIGEDDALRRFYQAHIPLGASVPVFLAVAGNCDEWFPIAVAPTREMAERAGEAYLAMYPHKFDLDGNFVNGHGAEYLWVHEIKSLIPQFTP